ncbi:MAG: hypothetical protein NTX51_17845, partial [Verrucomicrobia bacterium]|nr:hypothetical protein [Verrucomicrobiota bacterium]
MAKKPGVKAIITSGYNTQKADLEAARTSGILYLPKPWVFKELVEIMGAMMGTGNPKAEIRGARGDTDCILMFAHEARAPHGEAKSLLPVFWPALSFDHALPFGN